MKKLLLSTLILLGLIVMGANSVSKADSYGDDWLNETPHISNGEPAVRTVLEKTTETAEKGMVYYADEWWHENPHLYDDEPAVRTAPEKTVEGEVNETIQYGDEWWHENPHLY